MTNWNIFFGIITFVATVCGLLPIFTSKTENFVTPIFRIFLLFLFLLGVLSLFKSLINEIPFNILLLFWSNILIFLSLICVWEFINKRIKYKKIGNVITVILAFIIVLGSILAIPFGNLSFLNEFKNIFDPKFNRIVANSISNTKYGDIGIIGSKRSRDDWNSLRSDNSIYVGDTILIYVQQKLDNPNEFENVVTKTNIFIDAPKQYDLTQSKRVYTTIRAKGFDDVTDCVRLNSSTPFYLQFLPNYSTFVFENLEKKGSEYVSWDAPDERSIDNEIYSRLTDGGVDFEVPVGEGFVLYFQLYYVVKSHEDLYN